MLLLAALAATMVPTPVFAQASTEVIAPGATVTTPPGSNVTTIVQSPSTTTITKVTSTAPQSAMLKLKDGNQLERDSDGSVYIVYADGARITAPDGIHTLLGGSTVTVKGGKQIP
jgi:hypothetical protein